MPMQRLRISFNVFFVHLLFILAFTRERQHKLAEHENVDIRFAIIIEFMRLLDASPRFSVNLHYERVISRVYMIYNVS